MYLANKSDSESSPGRACAPFHKEYTRVQPIILRETIRSGQQTHDTEREKKTAFVHLNLLRLRVHRASVLSSSCSDPVAPTCWGPWLPLVQHTGPEVVRRTAARWREAARDRNGSQWRNNERRGRSWTPAQLLLFFGEPGRKHRSSA